jgi:hypothetical protein
VKRRKPEWKNNEKGKKGRERYENTTTGGEGKGEKDAPRLINKS